MSTLWWKVALPLLAALVLGLYEWSTRRLEHNRKEFVRRVARRIGERHRELTVLGEEPLALRIRSGSTDFRMSLDKMHRRFLRHPARFEEIVDAHLATVRESVATHGTLPFETASPRILPQVKNREFLRVNEQMGEGRGVVWRPLVDEIVVSYVLDSEHGMTYLTHADLAAWRKGADEIHAIALENLRRRSAPLGGRIDPSTGVQVIRTRDGYDAARVLILNELLKEAREDLLVGLPDRDTLMVMAVPVEKHRKVAVEFEKRIASAGHAVITRKVFRLTPTGIVSLG